MELGTVESDFIYEDRVKETDSLSQHGESEDEDSQKEIEVMLYSHVYFDDSSIKETAVTDGSFSEPSVMVKPVEDGSKQAKPKNRIFSRNEANLSSANLRLPSGCVPSQFNHPYRTKASRYYDVRDNSKTTFVAPRNPDKVWTRETESRKEFSTPTDFTSKLMARSANEKSYQPSSSKPKKHVTKRTAKVGSERLTENSQSNFDSDNQVIATACEQLVTMSDELSEKASNLNTAEEAINKNSNASSSDGLSAKTSFDAKISKVLSSMLDDESRSSLDENHPISSANHSQRNMNSESGWSVGMSWADMSSKRFEVDIEEESVSSMQLQDNSVTADSDTIVPNQIETWNDADCEPSEPSRYDLQLKDKHKENEVRPKIDSESESEASSIVEVVPPTKPAPPLVELSDEEDVSVNQKQQGISKRKQSSDRDIIVLSKGRKKVVELTIDSSSDDDPILLDERMPSSTTDRVISPRRSMKRNSEDPSGPRKRTSVHQDHEGVLQIPLVSDLHEKNNSDDLNQWLYNPIKSSRSMDHKKLRRKMSNDPKLWKMCQADVSGLHHSPHGPKCANCNQFGHKTKFCRAPPKVITCHMCGAPGHTETRCSQKMCLRCGTKNHVFVDRCKNCTTFYTDPCKICRSRRHEWKQCPDLWRRYHVTVTEGEIVQPAHDDITPQTRHYCSNCAGKGHLSHECKKSQWKCESISPFIVSYLSASDEDRKFEGTNAFVMLLTDESAAILSSPQGNNFLKRVSLESNVTIHTSFDLDLKKAVLEGTTQDVLATRPKILNWVKEQKKKCKKGRTISMFATRVLKKLWSSPEGKAHIEKLSEEHNVVINTGSVSTEKKFFFVGSESDVKETIRKIKQLLACYRSSLPPFHPSSLPLSSNSEQTGDKGGKIQAEKTACVPETSGEGNLKQTEDKDGRNQANKTACVPETSSDKGNLCHDVRWLPRHLPKDYNKLADTIDEELILIESPQLTDLTVGQLHCYLSSIPSSTKDTTSIHTRKCYARLLCIILLGKCGFVGGHDDVKALKTLVIKLRGREESLDKLYNEVKDHYQAIFAGDHRDDFDSLVENFYANKSLVNKFERQDICADPCKVVASNVKSVHPESSSQTAPRLKGSSTAVHHMPSETEHIDTLSMTFADTTEDDVWPQRVVKRSRRLRNLPPFSPAKNLAKKKKYKKKKNENNKNLRYKIMQRKQKRSVKLATGHCMKM